MHRAESRLKSWVESELKSTSCYQLKQKIALDAASDLQLDTIDYAYSGLVSLCESIASFKRNGYSWGTVKAYYATFYLLRAYLAAKNVALFYRDSNYWYVECIDSAAIVRADTSTHVAVIGALKKQSFSRNILQEESGETIVDKLKHLRELANYSNSPFSDPNPFPQIKTLSEGFDAKRILGDYGRDPMTYAYTDGHALLAFPVFIWTKVKEERVDKEKPIAFNREQQKFLGQFLEQFNCKKDFERSLFCISQ